MFSWRSPQPQQTTPSSDRGIALQRQITSLHTHCPNVVVLRRDELFEVPLKTEQGVLSFHVYLPPTFPDTAPIIRLVSPQAFPNPRNDPNGLVLEHSSLARWDPSQPLGRIVREVMESVRRNPPKPPTQSSPSAGTPNNLTPTSTPIPRQSPPRPPTMNSTQATSSQAQKTPLHERSSQYPQLAQMSANDLEALLSDESRMFDFLHCLPQLADIRVVPSQIRESNAKLAKENLEKEGKIKVAVAALNEAKEIQSKEREKLMEAHKKLDALVAGRSKQVALERLRKAKIEAEANSDAIAERFLSGEITPEEFIKSFQETRITFHMRAAKEERAIATGM